MSSLRLFVALYPPPDTARAMLAALADLTLPAHRATPPEQVHVTVQFIGDVPVRDLDEVTESVERAASGLRAVTLSPQRLISLPERGPARLVAAETDAPGDLGELKRRLVVRLARHARRERDRPFLPHLTLCRFRAPTRMERVAAPLPLPPFPVDAVKLMKSVLHPSGARHDEVATFALGERG